MRMMKYKKKYDDESKNEQGIHNSTWQDMGKVKEFPEIAHEENDPIQKKEKIPKVSIEEQQTLQNWRNSEAMQKGLQDILPKNNTSDANTDQYEHENLPQLIQRQEIQGQEEEEDEESQTGAASRVPAVAVPGLIDITSINDPVARNNQIIAWYNMADGIMNQYLGTPQVPSWVTYGQHASFNAGTQIRNLDDGIAILDHSANILNNLVALDPVASFKSAVKVFNTILGLLSQ